MSSLASSDRNLDQINWPLVLSTALVCGLGLYNLASATRNMHAPGESAMVGVHFGPLVWQAVAMAGGAALVGLFLLVDYRWLYTIAWPFYAVVVGMLFGVAVHGKKVLGAKRWLVLPGGIQIQPSEFLKVALILVLARFFAADETGVQKGRYGLRDLWRPFAIILIPVGLVLKQPDLGTAMVTFFIAMTMILFARVRWQSLSMLLVGATGVAVLAWKKFMHEFQKDRIRTFLNPGAYAKTKAYHAIQSVIAVGSGQFAGKGWKNGTQNQLSFLPEQHTDFIFSVWAEEHGFFGGILLVIIYGAIVLFALEIASNARDKFGSFLCIGVAGLFFWHVFINIGMVTGLLPVVGVPLPLFSYGGSSVIVDLMGIGVLLNVGLRRHMF